MVGFNRYPSYNEEPAFALLTSKALPSEMTGRWVVAVRIVGPIHDQVTHTIDVEQREC